MHCKSGWFSAFSMLVLGLSFCVSCHLPLIHLLSASEILLVPFLSFAFLFFCFLSAILGRSELNGCDQSSIFVWRSVAIIVRKFLPQANTVSL